MRAAVWTGYSASDVARIGPAQLTTSGTVIPLLVLPVPGGAVSADVAIFPAPNGLPLGHSLP